MNVDLFAKFKEQNHKNVKLILEVKEDKKTQGKKEDDDVDIMD